MWTYGLEESCLKETERRWHGMYMCSSYFTFRQKSWYVKLLFYTSRTQPTYNTGGHVRISPGKSCTRLCDVTAVCW